MTDGWVDASSASDAWVDPRMHLLEDTAAEEALGFNLAASYQRASHSLLLANHRVFLLPGMASIAASTWDTCTASANASNSFILCAVTFENIYYYSPAELAGALVNRYHCRRVLLHHDSV